MITSSYLPRTGGTERQLALLAAALTSRDVHVEVLTARRSAAWPLREDVGGTSVNRLPYPRIRAMGTIVLLARAASFLSRHAKRFEVFHAHTLDILAVLTVIMGRVLGRPVVVKAVGARELEAGVLNPVRRRTLRTRAMLAILRRADAWIAVSSHLRRAMEQAGVPTARIRTIPNGVDTDRFMPVSAFDARPASVRAGDRAVFVGRLVEEKGLRVLLRAWTLVRRRLPDAALDVVGTGPLDVELRQLAATLGLGPAVAFHGFHDDVMPFLRAADVFVLASSIEGLSNALLEAMAVGLPVVATRVSGTEDLVIDGETGLLVPPNDADALAHALISLLAAPEDRSVMGTRGRERVVDRCAIARVVAEHLRVYRDVLRR